jgi:predicted RNA-binding Zn-ribbon protein involved in translation (DUF1610 family)
MFARVRRVLGRFFDRSRTMNNQPLNKISLIVILLVDLFILTNVFTGIDDISRWHLNPAQAHPCYSEWQTYQTQTTNRKDYDVLRQAISAKTRGVDVFDYSGSYPHVDISQKYQADLKNKLGTISNVCFDYAGIRDKINTSENQQTVASIDRLQADISKLASANQTIKSQYDSSLLEKIAGQERGRSINQVGAEKAKQTLTQNNLKISTLNLETTNLKNTLVNKPESTAFISLLKDNNKFAQLKSSYHQASFWYPSIQFGLQTAFLLPLLFGASLIYNFAQRRGYGLVALISWHLLVIFLIPLLFKVLEFLQVGLIFNLISSIIYRLFGSLLFLISYVYILLVPLVGFGIIKVFQEFVFNSKIQTAKRVQKSQCINCARKIRSVDIYCPHCSQYQLSECQNCHQLTYKDLPYCNHCGHSQLENRAN